MDAADGEERWPWYRKAQAERGIRGWSYAELGRRIGEDPENTRRWLLGKAAPREGVVGKIAAALGWPHGLLADPSVGYVFDVERKSNTQWLKSVLTSLDEHGKKVVAALADPTMAEFLASQVDHWRALRRRMRGETPRPTPPTD